MSKGKVAGIALGLAALFSSPPLVVWLLAPHSSLHEPCTTLIGSLLSIFFIAFPTWLAGGWQWTTPTRVILAMVGVAVLSALCLGLGWTVLGFVAQSMCRAL